MNDDEVVADASAIIALLLGERFDQVDPERLTRARVSAVNLSEVLAKLQEIGLSDLQAVDAIAPLCLRVSNFDEIQAQAAARLRSATRQAGLSLGDRACLALALTLGCHVITADRAWSKVDVGVEMVFVR